MLSCPICVFLKSLPIFIVLMVDTWKKLKCEAHIAKPSQRDATPPVQNRSVTSQYPARKLMLSYSPTPSPPASHSQGGVNCNPLWACAQLSLITPRWPPAALLGRAANILRFCTRSDFALTQTKTAAPNSQSELDRNLISDQTLSQQPTKAGQILAARSISLDC